MYQKFPYHVSDLLYEYSRRYFRTLHHVGPSSPRKRNPCLCLFVRFGFGLYSTFWFVSFFFPLSLDVLLFYFSSHSGTFVLQSVKCLPCLAAPAIDIVYI